MVTAVLEVHNPSAVSESVSIAIEAVGTERIDRNFVFTYHPAESPVETDGRRETREIFRHHWAVVARAQIVAPGASKAWLILLQLPEDIPPTYRGTAVRYAYQLQAITHRTPGGATAPHQQPEATPPHTPNQPIDGTFRSAAPEQDNRKAGSHGMPGKSTGGVEEAARLLGTAASQLSTVRAGIHVWPPAPGGWDRRQPGAVIAGDDAQAPLTEYHLGCQGSDLSIQYQELAGYGGSVPEAVRAVTTATENGLEDAHDAPASQFANWQLAPPSKRASPSQQVLPNHHQHGRSGSNAEEFADAQSQPRSPFSERWELHSEPSGPIRHPSGRTYSNISESWIASALPPRIPESETDDSSPKSLPAHDQASSHRHRLAGSGLGQSTFNANLRIATSQAQQSSGLSSAEGSPRNSPYRAGARELGLSQLGAARNPQGNLLTHPSVDKFRFEAGMQQPNGSVVPPRHPKGSIFPPLRTHSELSLGSAVDSPLANATPSQPLDIQGHRSYNLRVGDRPLVRLSLHSPLFGEVTLGGTINGAIDMRASHEAALQDPAAPKCVQVVVLLETEEWVQNKWRGPHTSVTRKVYDEHQELTPDLLLTHFILSLPVDACPSFATPLVSLRWVLHFEFTTSVPAAKRGWLSGAPAPERIAWSLPVLVWPPEGA